MAFGIALSVRSRVRECTPALLNQVLDSHQTARVCAEIEDALEQVKRGEMSREDFETLKAERKKQLAILTPHATFPKGRRHNEDAVPSGLSMYDIDHIADPRGYFRAMIGDRAGELGIVLAHVTPSTEGLRLFFVMPSGMNLEQAQRWMSRQLGDENYDGCVKDLARCSFVVPRDYILYLDEEELFKERSLTPNPSPKGEGSSYQQAQTIPAGVSTPLSLGEGTGERLFKGIPYQDIIAEWFRRTGGEPQTGERNDRLHRLAAHLRYITDNDEAQLLSIMPRYGLSEDEMRGLIHSACQAKFCSMPLVLRKVVAELSDNHSATATDVLASLQPQMPKRLSKLMRLLVSKEPKVYHPTVANAVFPSLAAHFVGVKFPYIDNTLREATFMQCTVAPMSSGKSCVDRVVERIIADIRERDRVNIDRENEWKQQCKTRGSNKEKPRRPEGLCIQVLDTDMTNAAFVQKLVDAQGKYLYTMADEVELFYQLKTNGNKSVGKIFRLAFDNKPYGQVRVGVESVSGSQPLRWNWNASTTIQQGKRFFRNMMADGTLSRINFSTILVERDQPIPVHGTYDTQFDEQLKPYIDRLNAARGVVDCPQARKLVKRMLDENAEVTGLGDDELYERLSYRAVIIAWLKAMTLYVAEGRWSKEIEEFAVWSMRYDMWCKTMLFGEEMRQQMAGEVLADHRGPQNLLCLLPDTFTRDDALRMRLQQGRDDKVTPMLCTWRNRGYVEYNSESQRYNKIGKWASAAIDNNVNNKQ